MDFDIIGFQEGFDFWFFLKNSIIKKSTINIEWKFIFYILFKKIIYSSKKIKITSEWTSSIITNHEICSSRFSQHSLCLFIDVTRWNRRRRWFIVTLSCIGNHSVSFRAIRQRSRQSESHVFASVDRHATRSSEFFRRSFIIWKETTMQTICWIESIYLFVW